MSREWFRRNRDLAPAQEIHHRSELDLVLTDHPFRSSLEERVLWCRLEFDAGCCHQKPRPALCGSLAGIKAAWSAPLSPAWQCTHDKMRSCRACRTVKVTLPRIVLLRRQPSRVRSLCENRSCASLSLLTPRFCSSISIPLDIVHVGTSVLIRPVSSGRNKAPSGPLRVLRADTTSGRASRIRPIIHPLFHIEITISVNRSLPACQDDGADQEAKSQVEAQQESVWDVQRSSFCLPE